MRRYLAVLVAALLLLVAAAVARAQLSTTGVGSFSRSSSPPVTCSGALDLSQGCVIPGLG